MAFLRGVTVILVFIHICSATINLRRIVEPLLWEGVDLGGFESPTMKTLYKSTGNYIPKNMVAIKGTSRLDKAYFIMPRMKDGVPCTLVSLDSRQPVIEPMFMPYPDLKSHELGNCKAIQNAVDFFMDNSGNLWVLDSGIVETLSKPKSCCSPKVVCISTITNRITKVIDLGGLISHESVLQKIIVDFDWQRKPYLYIGDGKSGSILVYDVIAEKGHLVVLPKEIKKSGDSVEILYQALVKKASGQKYLYVTFFSSAKIYAIKTENLISGKCNSKIMTVASKPAPILFLGTDSQSKIFFRYHNDPAIYSWDISEKFDPENLEPVYTNNDECLLATSVFTDSFRSMKVLESNYGDFVHGECGCGVVHRISEMTRDLPSVESNTLRKLNPISLI